MKTWSKVLDLICFVVGPFITAICLSGYHPNSGWNNDNELGIAVGIALICFGLLRKYWARKGRGDQ